MADRAVLRCSPEAFAKCEVRDICGSLGEAAFLEGSECERFNQSVAAEPMTNADRIRAMSDEELAAFLTKHDVEQNRLRLESNGIVPTATQLEVLCDTLYCTWRSWLCRPVEECEV